MLLLLLLRRTTRAQVAVPPRLQKRALSIRGVYSTFPATLMYYSPLRRVALYEYVGNETKDDLPLDDAVMAAGDGLVYPAVSVRNDIPYSNGAVMMPNTMGLQINLREYVSEFFKFNPGCPEHLEPQLYTVRKGTKIPDAFILFHEVASRFSLQPRKGLHLKDINEQLTRFFRVHAMSEGVRPWLRRNFYMYAAKDKDEDTWMGR